MCTNTRAMSRILIGVDSRLDVDMKRFLIPVFC